MCLITKQKKPFIAQEDVICYKGLSFYCNMLRSPIQNFTWQLGKLYKNDLNVVNKIKKESIGCGCIFKYADNLSYKYYSKLRVNLTIITTGFHSCNNIERLINMDYSSIKVYECIIPKGSLYFEDETGLLVSNQIIIQKIIK